MNYFESINPTNGQIIKEYLALSEDELNEILLNTDKRFDSWKKNSVDERSTYFLEIAEIIDQKKNELSELNIEVELTGMPRCSRRIRFIFNDAREMFCSNDAICCPISKKSNIVNKSEIIQSSL